MTGVKRNIEHKISLLLTQFPIVAIIGARQVGKTTLSKNIMPDWQYFDLEKLRDYDRISHDPDFFFEQHAEHLIIDEAQEYLDLFRVLRGIVDEKPDQNGRFILTGSSNPELLNHVSETLAGRVAIVELGTLKANEFYEKPLSDFYQLFETKLSPKQFIQGKAPLSLSEMHMLWLKGGYPKPLIKQELVFYQQWMDNYRKTYVNRDLAKLFPRLNKLAYNRFLSILSKLSGTIINKSDVARSIEVSEGTIREYLTIADGTFLWRQLYGFEKNVVKAIVKMPKGYIRDTGLLHYLLRISEQEDLYNDPVVGRSFESFVIEELLKGLEATMVANWQAYYYRTRNGAEIDLILDGPFGTLPIEIKYGSSVNFKQLATLSNFIEEHQLPFGMLINQSDKIEWLTPKIVQMPVGWL